MKIAKDMQFQAASSLWQQTNKLNTAIDHPET